MTKYIVLQTILVAILIVNSRFGFGCEELLLERTAAIHPSKFPSPVYEVSVELGDLPISTDVRLRLSVTNGYERAFKIGYVESGCSCLRAKTVGIGEFAPKSDTVIEVTLKTPTHAKEQDHRQILMFRNSPEGIEGFDLTVSYSLAGLLAFKSDSFHYTLKEAASKKDAVVRVPFICSLPVKLSNIQAKCNGGLKPLDCTLKKIEGVEFVEVRIPAGSDWADLPVELLIEDAETKAKASINLFLSKELPLTISPELIRFNWSEQERAYTANAIIRVAESDDNPNRKLQIDAWLPNKGESILKSNVRNLNSSIARIDFVLDVGGRFMDGKDSKFQKIIAIEITGSKRVFREELQFLVFP